MAPSMLLIALTLLIWSSPCKGFTFRSGSFLLSGSQPITTVGWTVVKNWEAASNGGYHLADLALSNGASDVQVPESALYLIGSSVTLTGADIAKFYLAIVVNHDLTTIPDMLIVEAEGEQLGSQGITTHGILSLQPNDVISVYVKADEDTAWAVAGGAKSSFYLKDVGGVESATGFSARLPRSLSVAVETGWTAVRDWKTDGHAGLLNSGTGFSESSGEFSASCHGIYFFTTNLKVDATSPEYFRLALSIDGNSNNNVVMKSVSASDTMTMSVSVELQRGQTVNMALLGNGTSYVIRKGSGFSGVLLSKADDTVAGFSGASSSLYVASGEGWMKIPIAGADEGKEGQFQRTVMNDVSDGSYFAPKDGQYIVTANILVETNSPVVSAILSLRSDAISLSNGISGIYQTITRPANQGTVVFTLTGVFYLSTGQPVTAFLYQQNTDSYTILTGSRFSACLTQLSYPGLHETIPAQTLFTADNTWVELTQWSLRQLTGVFSFTSSMTSGRYTASKRGLYFVSVNAIFENVDGPISLLVSVNGKLSKREGFFSTKGNPVRKDALNVAGSLHMSAGDYVSVFAKVGGDTSWSIGAQTSLSIVYLSPTFSSTGFTAVLSSRVNARAGWKQVGGFTASPAFPLFNFGGGFDATTGEYTAPSGGLYLVTANLKLQTASALNAKFTLVLAVNGDPSGFTYLNGIDDFVVWSSNPPADNDFYTMSLAGVVNLVVGSKVSLWIEAVGDTDWSISEDSTYSVVLATEQSHASISGIHSVLDPTISQAVTGATSYKKIRYWTTVRTDTSAGQFVLDRHLYLDGNAGTINVKESGLYFINAVVVLSNANAEFELVVFSTSSIAALYSSVGNTVSSFLTLKVCGVLHLSIGASLSLQVRSTKSSWQQEIKHSSFSAMRISPYMKRASAALQMAKHVDVGLQPDQWSRLSGWRPSLYPSFFVMGLHYQGAHGVFTVPQTAIYFVSATVDFENVFNKSSYDVRIGINGDASVSNQSSASVNGMSASTTGCLKRCTAVLSGVTSLKSGDTVAIYIQSPDTSSLRVSAESVITIAAVSENSPMPNGMLGFLNDDLKILFDGTQATTKWNIIPAAGSFFGTTGSEDGFQIEATGVYIVAINMKVRNHIGLLRLHASVNNIGAISTAMATTSNEENTMSLSGCMYMATGVFSTVTIFSDGDTDYELLNTSSKSILRLGSLSDVTGFTARSASSFIVLLNRGQPKVIGQWSTADTAWAFEGGAGIVSGQTYVVPHSGIYFVAANIIVEKFYNFTSGGAVTLFLSQNGVLSAENTVSSVTYVNEDLILTVSLSASIYLKKWTAVQLVMMADQNMELKLGIVSTFTVARLGKDMNPSLCNDPGPSVNHALLPSLSRVLKATRVSWTCKASGDLLAYTWRKNFKVIDGATSSVYTIASTVASNTGVYTCTAISNDVKMTSTAAELVVYDPSPVFLGANHSFKVVENNDISVSLFNLSIRAESLESSFAPIQLEILSGDTNGSLYLDPIDTISVTQVMSRYPLDREFIPVYNITIQATNMHVGTKSSQLIHIDVEDVNDNPPSFSLLIHHANVSEDAPIGTMITVVKATDADTGVNALIRYFIIPGSAKDVFKMNSTTGQVVLMQDLDRETREQYTLFIRATDGVFTSFTELMILVQDINEFPPMFAPNFYNISVSESLPSGSSILRVLASDRDSGRNGQVIYWIEAGAENGLFRVTETGEVINTQQLDYETNRTFVLLISALDNAQPQMVGDNKATVIINVMNSNDNSPQFDKSQYFEKVSEDAPVNAHVLKVRAIDKDQQGGVIAYSIPADQEVGALFKINASSGAITLIGQLDYETNVSHTFDVMATDDGSPPVTARTKVEIEVVDVNDNRPKFANASIKINVPEDDDSNALTLLQVKATDADNGANGLIQYSLENGNVGSTFLIDPNSGDVIAIRPLDREVIGSYTLTIQATDSSVSPLSADPPLTLKIYVLDVNDNRPEFAEPSFSVTVSELSEIGNLVVFLNVTDSDAMTNGEFDVRIIEDDAAKIVAYDEIKNGLVLKEKIDFETMPRISFTVSARDRGTPALENSVKVVILVEDVNDNVPVFSPSSYSVAVPHMPPGNLTIVQVRAVDLDAGPGGHLKYGIASGNDGEWFTIDQTTGIIRTAFALNTSHVAVYNLEVVANDTFNPPMTSSLTPVVIRVDRQPSLPIIASSVGVSTMTFTVNISDFSGFDVDKYQIIVQEYHSDVEGFNEATKLPPVFWYQVNMLGNFKSNFLKRYIAIEVTPSKRRRRTSQLIGTELTANIGVEVNCNLLANAGRICNGPLKPSQSYRIQVIAFPTGEQLGIESIFTKPYEIGSGSSSASIMDEADGMVGLAVTYVFTVLFIVFIFCAFVMWKRQHELIHVDHVVDRKVLEELPQTSLVMVNSGHYLNGSGSSLYQIGFNPVNGLSEISMWPRMSMAEKSHFYHRSHGHEGYQNDAINEDHDGMKNYGYEAYGEEEDESISSRMDESDDERSLNSPRRSNQGRGSPGRGVQENSTDLLLDRGIRATHNQFSFQHQNGGTATHDSVTMTTAGSQALNLSDASGIHFHHTEPQIIVSRPEPDRESFGHQDIDDSEGAANETVLGPIVNYTSSFRNEDEFPHEDENFDDMDDDTASGLNINL